MCCKALLPAIIILLLLLALTVSGCCCCPITVPVPSSVPSPSTTLSVSGSATPASSTTIAEITDMSVIDEALAAGPVFVEFGAEWCGWCEKEAPVLEQLSAEYPGIAFYHVDTDMSPGLAGKFYVSGIPQMALIVKKNSDGSYLYVGLDGKTGSDRYKSRIIGYQTYDALKPLLDAAMAAR